MPDTLFISYKSEENPFALQLAAALKNRGIHIWIDRMDIKPADNWIEAISAALQICNGMIAILTPDYFRSQVCLDELNTAYEKKRLILPLLLRPNIEERDTDLKDKVPFWLPHRQHLDFTDWLDDKAFQAKVEELVERIQRDQHTSVGDLPSAEIQYLNTLIADLESQQGVENYITLTAQSEVVRVDPRPHKNIEASLKLLLKPPTAERDERPETKKIDNIQQAVADHAKFVLIGDPGAGKTTTLRRLALEMARARLEAITSPPDPLSNKRGGEMPLPFLVYLPRWSSDEPAADFMRRQWALTSMGGDVVRELHSGQVRLYLDGLNEMGGEGKTKATLLREWLQSPDGPRHAIITCRQGDYHGDLDLKLPTVLVEPLTDEKIREFAVQYLGKEQVGPFLSKVSPKSEWKIERSLIHLARNPYLLAALTLIFENGGDLPRNTGALFHQLVMVLWERERLRQTPGWIPFEKMQAAFGNLAFGIIDEGQPIDVRLKYAEGKLGNADLLGVGRSANLITMNGDEMRFSHQLMLEYFAAAGLLKVGPATKLKNPTLEYFGRMATKWDEVVVASCGLASDPSSVVNQVVGVDPFLAADCLGSGIEVTAATHDKVITSLSAALHDTNDWVRDRAADALGNIADPAAIPALLDALNDDHSAVRRNAAEALGNIADPAAIPALVDTLQDAESLVRSGAADALGRIGDPTAIPALLDALHDAKSDVRDRAADALGNIGTPAIPALSDALHDAKRGVRSMAARALGSIGTPAIPALSDALHDADSDVRSMAARALGSIGTPAIPALSDALHDADSAVRTWAAVALGNIADPTAIPALSDALHDADINVLLQAAVALSNIGTLAIPALSDALHDANRDVRHYAAHALGNIRDPTAVPALSDALHDANWDVRHNAADALGKIGDPTAVPALLNALHDADDWVRFGAANALGKIGDPTAVPALSDALHDAYSSVRYWAANALGKIGDPVAIPALSDALHDADDRVRFGAAWALGKAGDPAALPTLLDALHDADYWVRYMAAEALGYIGDPAAVPALIERLTDYEKPVDWTDEPVCDVAAEALEKIGTPEALEAVRRWREEQLK